MNWILDHYEEIGAALAALWALVSIIVRLAPSPDDDRLLRRLAERASFLQPKDGRGVLSVPGRPAKRQCDPDERLTGRR